jgi:lipoic acid synthetase
LEKNGFNMEHIKEIEKIKKPDWLRVKLPTGENYIKVRGIVSKHKLNTICESGNCPNMGECWGVGTATFMILGNICTRSCGFCAVATGKPNPADWDEPKRIAESVKLMNVKHCVITSVDRDDLKDGGSIIWAETIKEIRAISPETKFECLIPDFAGKWDNLQRIIDVKPDIVSHNIETVRRLTAQVRIQAKYDRSIEVLKRLDEAGVKTKSGIMLGLGETEKEIFETIDDLAFVKCDVITMGQYLQPTPKHLPVDRFVHPDDFKKYKDYALNKGFKFVESGPLVRSSYHAEKHIF